MSEFDTLLEAARNEQTDPQRAGILIGQGKPRFELFHFGFSICSQKVRSVLMEKQIPFVSNDFKPTENYRPGYVRLRMFAAGPELLNRLAVEHTMRTSVETEGFDACVVPLLVDLEKKSVIVDSAKIIEYIDREVPERRLIPADPALAKSVREQIKINDDIPHPGILYGFHENDPRPPFWIQAMDGVYDGKRSVLEKLIEENRDDAELVRIYEAKITKEMAGKKIQKDPAYMAGIIKEFEQITATLADKLASHDGPWVCGSEFTMADCVWAVSLYRIQWLGHAYLWDSHPSVRDYAYRLYDRPSVRSAIIEWPDPMPPSQHTTDVDPPRASA